MKIAQGETTCVAIMTLSGMPLSGPGKISTLLQRRKTVASRVRKELHRSGLGDRVRAEVVGDLLAGEVVTVVTCSAPRAADEDRRAEAAAALNGYATGFRRTDNVAVCNGDEVDRGDGRHVEAVRL